MADASIIFWREESSNQKAAFSQEIRKVHLQNDYRIPFEIKVQYHTFDTKIFRAPIIQMK